MSRPALHRALVGIALASAALAAWLRGPRLAPATGAPPAAGSGEVTALDLAQWIHDRENGLRIIDLRPAADYAVEHVPTAENLTLEALAPARFATSAPIVFYARDEAAAARAATSLREAGRQALVLRGGLPAWLAEVMAPVLPATETAESRRAAALSRYFGGSPRRAVPAAPSPWRGC